MSKNLRVIQKTSRVLEIIYKVVSIICLVGAIVALVGIVLLIVAGAFPKIADKIVSEADRNTKQLIGDCVVGFLVSATYFVVSKAHKDFFAMEQKVGTPFTKECAASFRTLGIINIVVPVALAVVVAIVSAIFNCWDDFRLDFSLGVGIAMILLSFVLAYGAELEEAKQKEANQKESSQKEVAPVQEGESR